MGHEDRILGGPAVSTTALDSNASTLIAAVTY